MIEAGLTPDQITVVLRILERDERDAKAKSADRSRAYRARQRDAKRDAVTVTAETAPPSRARVVDPSSSLRSEGEEPTSLRSVGARKRASSTRRALIALPGDWQPSAALVAYGRERGFDGAGVADEADGMRSWAASNGITKVDWDATFQGWLRRSAERRQQSRPPARAGPPIKRDIWAEINRATRDLGNEPAPLHENGDNRTGAGPGCLRSRAISDHREDPQRGSTIDVEPLRDRGGTGTYGR